VADNKRLVGRDTQLTQIGQALNRAGAGKAVFLEFHAHRTDCPPDGGALIVHSARRWPIGDGEQPDDDWRHPQCHLVPPIGHNWAMSAAATALAAAVERQATDLCMLSRSIHAEPEWGHACGHNIIAASSVGAVMPHGIVTHGGAAPNVVPAHTSVLYYLCASDVESLQQLETRVRACFEAGALATGCAHEVTRVLPVIHPTIAIDCGDAVNHQPEFATACATSSADRAACDGALALALTGLAGATDDAQRERLVSALPRRSGRNDARAAAQ
jgi:acetylornithine deacetylase/succinyl-diaminopimelate desuccinylase-like protein